MIEKIAMPNVGEGVETGIVVAIRIQPGDQVKVNDTVVELETDKAVVEIPSTVEGKVVNMLVSEGDEIRVGDTIAEVETNVAATDEDASFSQEDSEAIIQGVRREGKRVLTRKEEDRSTSVEEIEPKNEETTTREEKPAQPSSFSEMSHAGEEAQAAATKPKRSFDQPVPASPSIRRLARELGVDIRRVEGGGPGGRITESDIKAHVKNRLATMSTDREGKSFNKGPELPDFTRWGEVEVQAIETVRRITAESTARSWRAVPHVTQFDEADMTSLEAFLTKNAQKVSTAGGKLTLTAVVTKVCSAALQKFPRFNASLDPHGQRIIYKKFIHIGIAVDTPRGLLMPVVRDADTKSITALAVEIADLARRCRSKKIQPTELEGGTFSISNQGGIGGVGFTPIVHWPQAAILGVSRASLSPRPMGDCIEWRKKLPFSLSYDHRIIDGADAARFLGWICESLSLPFTLVLD